MQIDVIINAQITKKSLPSLQSLFFNNNIILDNYEKVIRQIKKHQLPEIHLNLVPDSKGKLGWLQLCLIDGRQGDLHRPT